MPNLKISLIQTSLHWENAEANLKMFSEKIFSIENETDIILLPEMFTTGFSMNTSLAETMNGKTFEWMKNISAKKNSVICGSVMISENENFFNRLIWMQPDGQYFTYDKRHLFGLGDEHNHFTAGTKKIIVEWKGWKILPLICYDLRFPVWSRQQKNNLFDVLIYVANWPERRKKAWKALLLARAVENQSYVVGLNRVGVDGHKVYHSGDTMLIDTTGEIIFHSANEEVIKTIELRKENLEKTRSDFPFLNDADEFILNL